MHDYNVFWSYSSMVLLVTPLMPTLCPCTFPNFMLYVCLFVCMNVCMYICLSFNLCFLYTHAWGTIHWSMVDLPESTPLKLTLPPEKLLISKSFSVKGGCFWASPHCMLKCWPDFVWVLWRQPQLLHVYAKVLLHPKDSGHSGPPHPLALTTSLASLPWWPLTLGKRVWYKCPVCDWALHRCLFSIVWPIISFWVHTVHWTNEILWWDMKYVLICESRHKNLNESLILCPFSKQ